MSDNVTPISQPKLRRPTAVRIEKLRVRLFQAMAFVDTTQRALDGDDRRDFGKDDARGGPTR